MAWYWRSTSFTCWSKVFWRRASLVETAWSTAAWIRCWISDSETEAGCVTAGVTTRAVAGPPETGVPAGRAKEKTINATESIAADAKPSRAVEPQNAAHARRHGDGSKILSETKAIRCGISSSRSENKAASVT